MRCSLCSHENRSAIEAACKRGEIARVADQFGVSERALAKHISSHCNSRARTSKAKPAPTDTRRSRPKSARVPSPPPPAPSRTDDEEDAPITSRSPSSAVTARAKVNELLSTLKSIADEVRKYEDGEDGPALTLKARLELLKASVQPIRLLGQLTGELGASDATVAASPHYRRIRAAIVEALVPHPDALRAVEQALAKLEPGNSNTVEEAAA